MIDYGSNEVFGWTHCSIGRPRRIVLWMTQERCFFIGGCTPAYLEPQTAGCTWIRGQHVTTCGLAGEGKAATVSAFM